MAAIWVPLIRLEEIMGRDAARLLCTSMAGEPVYIGQTPRAEMAALVGEGPALALSKHYGGSDIVLPTAMIRPEPKKTRVAVMIEAGASIRDIVRECGCTARYVAEVKRDLRTVRVVVTRERKRKQTPLMRLMGAGS